MVIHGPTGPEYFGELLEDGTYRSGTLTRKSGFIEVFAVPPVKNPPLSPQDPSQQIQQQPVPAARHR